MAVAGPLAWGTNFVEKSVVSSDYALFRACLRQARRKAGLTQAQLAQRLGETQTFVSKCERGERRLDLLEARAFCIALGVPFQTFVEMLDARIARAAGRREEEVSRVHRAPGPVRVAA